ncbi:hypothetical protein EI94DRAFT_1706620 [Lactarius quietus]|nr:hypothetical protein EI94DRAFT_1706620 [Lactarius quietus]
MDVVNTHSSGKSTWLLGSRKSRPYVGVVAAAASHDRSPSAPVQRCFVKECWLPTSDTNATRGDYEQLPCRAEQREDQTPKLYCFVEFAFLLCEAACRSGQDACGRGGWEVQQRGLEKTSWKHHERWEEARQKMLRQKGDELSGDPSTLCKKWDQLVYEEGWQGERDEMYLGAGWGCYWQRKCKNGLTWRHESKEKLMIKVKGWEG